MSVATFTKTGTKSSTPVKLDNKVFGIKVDSHDLIQQAYVAYLANGRKNLAKTLKRGEVRGGGRKPWRQKGTGRARFGSIRNPIWRGGGITFGPEGNENYSHKMNTETKRHAIRQALSLKADNIKVVDTFAHMENKTKDMAMFLAKVDAKGRVLCVVSKKDHKKERATQNIPELKVTAAKYLNVYDIINADTIIISEKSLDVISEWLTPSPGSRSTKEGKK